MKVTVNLIKNYLNGVNSEPVEANVTGTEPFVWTYVPDGSSRYKRKHVTVKVTSKDKEVCGLVALQPRECPFQDLVMDAKYHSMWQTVMGTGTVGVYLEGAYARGFHLIAMEMADSEECTGKSVEISEGTVKSFSIIVAIGDPDISFDVLFITAGYVIFCLLMLFLAKFSIFPVEGLLQNKLKALKKELDSEGKPLLKGSDKHPSQKSEATEVKPTDEPTGLAANILNDDAIIESFKNLKRLHDDSAKKNLKEDRLRLSDMSFKSDIDVYQGEVEMKSSLYSWLVFLMGVFYSLPVLQFLLHHQKTVTGNMDICFYNYRCKFSYLGLEDFGSVFSNIAYVAHGLLFILLVRIREQKYREYITLRGDLRGRANRKGIPEQYGIFYAMGGACIMEGVLSGSYHICATEEHFQFDTTFMFVIAVLGFLKVYQFRHPDATSNAYTVFSLISLALLLEVLGIYFTHIFFWGLFLALYVLAILLFVIHTYYHGNFARFPDSWSEIFKSKKLSSIIPARKGRFLLCLIVFLINGSIAYFIGSKRKKGISNYLLLILLGNMAIYIGYYHCMKLIFWLKRKQINEKINWVSAMYFVKGILCWLVGVYFFASKQRATETTPALSRDMNGPCLYSIPF